MRYHSHQTHRHAPYKPFPNRSLHLGSQKSLLFRCRRLPLTFHGKPFLLQLHPHQAYDDRSLVPYRLDLLDDMTGSLPSGSCHKVHQILLKRQLLDGRFPSLLHSQFQSLQHLSLLQNHASLKIQHVLRCFYTRENLVPESPIPHPQAHTALLHMESAYSYSLYIMMLVAKGVLTPLMPDCFVSQKLTQLSHHVACHFASINLLHLRHLICTLLIRIRTARAKWTAAWRINRAWQFSFKHNTLS